MGRTFLVDINAARLAQWLRALRYDAALHRGVRRTAVADLVHRAGDQARTMLTRNARLMEHRPVKNGVVRAILLVSDRVRDQVRQVVRECGPSTSASLFRCLRCNAPLQSVPRERVRDRLPPHAHRTQRGFMLCPSRDRVYWRGFHWRSMRSELADFAGGSG